MCNTEFSGAGKGEYEVCAERGRERKVLVKDTKRKALEGMKKGKEKTDEGSSVLLYFVTEEGE